MKLHKQKMAIVHHQVPYSYKELPFRIEKKMKLQLSKKKVRYSTKIPLMKYYTEMSVSFFF